MALKVDISFGELLDKITILQIKSERIKDAVKLMHIHKELELLQSLWENCPEVTINIKYEIYNLKTTNEKLWEIEDAIRAKEDSKTFDEQFIKLARSMYITNDKRSELKRKINIKLKSEIVEEKCYAAYQ